MDHHLEDSDFCQSVTWKPLGSVTWKTRQWISPKQNSKQKLQTPLSHSVNTPVRFIPTTLPSLEHNCFPSFLIQCFVKKAYLKEWYVYSSFPFLRKNSQVGAQDVCTVREDDKGIIANLYFLSSFQFFPFYPTKQQTVS